MKYIKKYLKGDGKIIIIIIIKIITIIVYLIDSRGGKLNWNYLQSKKRRNPNRFENYGNIN